MSFSFGTPSSAPATTGLAGGFSFGANKPATPGLGLATSQPSTGLFGATPAASTSAFGATSMPSGFGVAATPAFGASSTPAFGATSTPAFGAASTSFGASTTPAFGAAGTSAFGATTTPAFGATSTSFGGAGLGTGGLNFGTGTNTSAPSTGLTFGAPTTSQPSLGLGGFSAPATSNTSGLWNFNTAASTAQNTSLLGGGAKLGTINLMGTQPATSVTQSVGLGGTSMSAGGIGAANTTSTGDGKSEPPKQTKLPNEIATSVDTFKEFVKKQKSLSSDIMRVSIKPLQKVAKDAEDLLRSVLSLSAEVGKARSQSRRLRGAGASALAAADTASQDMPYSEYDGFAPPAYVKELISELEQQLLTFRRQMDVADKQMQASPRLLSEQELTLGIRRMHESLVALAGRLQNVHSQVEAQKEQYLNLRKYVLKDPTDVFENQSPNNSLDQLLRDAEGGKRKNKLGLSEGFASAVLSDPRAALGNIHQLAGPTPFTYLSTNLTNLPGAETPGSAWQPQPQTNPSSSLNTSGFGTFGAADASTGFQLQKPPGKRTKQ